MAFESSKEIARSVKSELIMYRAILREEGKPTSAKLFLGLARTQTTLGKTIRLLWNPEQDYEKTRRAGTKERWKLIQSRITGLLPCHRIGRQLGGDIRCP